MGKAICGLLQLKDKGVAFILKKKFFLIFLYPLAYYFSLNFKIL